MKQFLRLSVVCLTMFATPIQRTLAESGSPGSHAARTALNQIEIQTTQGRPSATNVIVRISLNNDVDLASIAFTVLYDTSALNAVSYRKAGRTVKDPESGGIDDADGRIRIGIVDLAGGTAIPIGDGVIAEIVFDISADAAIGAKNLTVSEIDNVFSTNLSSVSLTGVHGTVTIRQFTLDIDNDGVPEVMDDGLPILRFLFGFRGDSSSNEILNEAISSGILDVDLNGKSDALTDGLLIVRYLAGITGTDLTNGVVAHDPTCGRCLSTDIKSYLDGLQP